AEAARARVAAPGPDRGRAAGRAGQLSGRTGQALARGAAPRGGSDPDAGPPELAPREQNVRMRLRGGRTGKRAVICENLELTGLMHPFDLEIWYGERGAG